MQGRPIALLLLLLGLGAQLGAHCATDDQIEHWRRSTEGGLDTPSAHAAAEAKIAALEQDLGGVVADTLAQRMAHHQTPGVQIAVVNGGRVEWTQAYGQWNSVSGAPLLRTSQLQSGSLSKPTTALAILMLVEAGLVDLDEPINDALTSWAVPENGFTATTPVTLRRILSHTSGMNNASFLGYGATAQIPTLLEVLDGVPPATTPPFEIVQTPGASWLYSGGAYTVLAQLLEDLTGEDFAAWLHQNVFLPAGMWRSTFEQPHPDPALYAFGGGHVFGFPVSAVVHPEQPAAGLWTTALDLGRLVVALQRAQAGEPGALLGAASAAHMITPQSPSPFAFQLGFSPDPRMGLGLFLADGPDPDWFWHTGANVGYTAILVGDTRGQGFGAAVVTNAFPDGRLLGWEIINGIADLYGWPGWGDWGI